LPEKWEPKAESGWGSCIEKGKLSLNFLYNFCLFGVQCVVSYIGMSIQGIYGVQLNVVGQKSDLYVLEAVFGYLGLPLGGLCSPPVTCNLYYLRFVV